VHVIHIFIDFLAVSRNTDLIIALRQYRPQGIPNEVVHSGFGFLLVSPVIQLRDFGLHLCQKINCYLFDLLNILFGKIFRKQEIIEGDRKSTRLNSSHVSISYAVFCLKKKKKNKKILARM